MSLVTQVSNLATRVGTEFKAVRATIGSLANLTTSEKTNIVGALNEVAASIGNAGASIDDAATSTLTVWSSSKVSGLTTTLRTDVDAAKALAQGKPSINDTTASTTSVYSSSKVNSEITAKVNALVGGAPGTLDTLKELADALGGDTNFSTTVTTALANRVRVDAAQSLTTGQKAQARSNIEAASSAEVGDTTTNFVTVFETALA